MTGWNRKKKTEKIFHRIFCASHNRFDIAMVVKIRKLYCSDSLQWNYYKFDNTRTHTHTHLLAHSFKAMVMLMMINGIYDSSCRANPKKNPTQVWLSLTNWSIFFAEILCILVAFICVFSQTNCCNKIETAALTWMRLI